MFELKQRHIDALSQLESTVAFAGQAHSRLQKAELLHRDTGEAWHAAEGATKEDALENALATAQRGEKPESLESEAHRLERVRREEQELRRENEELKERIAQMEAKLDQTQVTEETSHE